MMPSLLAVFGAGLVTVLSPCVLPVAPILIGGLVVGSDASRWSRLRASLWFGLGFAVVFTAAGLGLGAAMAIAPLRALFLVVAATVLGLYGAKMLGLVETTRLSWMNRTVGVPGPDRRPGMPRPMMLGALFALTWTPCAGPVLGGVLAYVASRPESTVPAASMLLAYAAGVATPLALIAVASEYMTPLLRRLAPRAHVIERATGVALLALAGVLAVQIRVPGDTRPGGAAAAFDEPGTAVAPAGARRLLFFHSAHCPTCRAMETVLRDVERACASDRWTLTPIDVDRRENAAIVARFGVRAVPTTSLVDERGHEDVRLVGFQSEAPLRDALERAVQVACADDGPPPGAPVEMPTCEVGRAC